jgi:hypothetical protein
MPRTRTEDIPICVRSPDPVRLDEHGRPMIEYEQRREPVSVWSLRFNPPRLTWKQKAMVVLGTTAAGVIITLICMALGIK